MNAVKKTESSIAERKEIAADLIFCRTILILVETNQRANCFRPKRLAPGLCETLQDMAYQKLRSADKTGVPPILESKRFSVALYAELFGVLCHQRFDHALSKIEPTITSQMQKPDSMQQKAKREVCCLPKGRAGRFFAVQIPSSHVVSLEESVGTRCGNALPSAAEFGQMLPGPQGWGPGLDGMG